MGKRVPYALQRAICMSDPDDCRYSQLQYRHDPGQQKAVERVRRREFNGNRAFCGRHCPLERRQACP
jgi:hypothetical protein